MTPLQAERWNDFILCCEMLLFALLHLKAFSHKEFRGGFPDTSVLGSVGEVGRLPVVNS